MRGEAAFLQCNQYFPPAVPEASTESQTQTTPHFKLSSALLCLVNHGESLLQLCSLKESCLVSGMLTRTYLPDGKMKKAIDASCKLWDIISVGHIAIRLEAIAFWTRRSARPTRPFLTAPGLEVTKSLDRTRRRLGREIESFREGRAVLLVHSGVHASSSNRIPLQGHAQRAFKWMVSMFVGSAIPSCGAGRSPWPWRSGVVWVSGTTHWQRLGAEELKDATQGSCSSQSCHPAWKTNSVWRDAQQWACRQAII